MSSEAMERDEAAIQRWSRLLPGTSEFTGALDAAKFHYMLEIVRASSEGRAALIDALGGEQVGWVSEHDPLRIIHTHALRTDYIETADGRLVYRNWRPVFAFPSEEE